MEPSKPVGRLTALLKSPAKVERNRQRPMTIFSYEGDRDTLLSIYDSLRYYKQILQTGFVVLDPKSGAVKAWVGGPDFTHFQLDHVRVTRRQVGSTMKPLLYGAAMDMGLIPLLLERFTSPPRAWSVLITSTWPICDAIDMGLTPSLVHRFTSPPRA